MRVCVELSRTAKEAVLSGDIRYNRDVVVGQMKEGNH